MRVADPPWLETSSMPPLLARTDCLATLPVIVMHEALDRYGLRAVAPPFEIPAMPHRFVWSERLTNDPAVGWLRELLVGTFATVLRESESQVPKGKRRP